MDTFFPPSNVLFFFYFVNIFLFYYYFFFKKKKPVPAKRPQTRPDLPPLVRGVLCCFFFFLFSFFFNFGLLKKIFEELLRLSRQTSIYLSIYQSYAG